MRDDYNIGLSRVGGHKLQGAVGHLCGPQNLTSVYMYTTVCSAVVLATSVSGRSLDNRHLRCPGSSRTEPCSSVILPAVLRHVVRARVTVSEVPSAVANTQ
uniref:Uncharacterized protein n=1 Tax=Eutreptiella gymnastica TaxID=73025 RepID=A0A6T2A1A8_9EUGL